MSNAPSSSAFVVQSASVEPLPVGSYFTMFKSVEPFSNASGTVKDKWRWAWEVVSGTHKGKMATALTDQKLTAMNHAGRLVSGMAGRGLQANEDVSALLASFVGKPFLVSVATGPKGGKPSVQSVSQPPEM
jgi:hypothetical protein